MSTSNRLDLQTLGSQQILPNNLPITEANTPTLWSGRTGCYLQTNPLSVRNNRLKLKTVGKLLIILEEIIEYPPI